MQNECAFRGMFWKSASTLLSSEDMRKKKLGRVPPVYPCDISECVPESCSCISLVDGGERLSSVIFTVQLLRR